MRRFIAIGLAGLGLAAATPAPASPAEPAGDERIVARSSKLVDGTELVFEKRLGADGTVRGVVLDGRGRALRQRTEPRGTRALVDRRLSTRLETLGRRGDPGETVLVDIALALPEPLVDGSPETGEAEISRGVVRRVVVDGLEVAPVELERRFADRSRARSVAGLRGRTARDGELRRWARRHGLDRRAAVARALEQAGATVTVALTRAELERLVRSGDATIRGIELHQASTDDITQAMADTSISTAALPYTSTRGNGIGIYMTESGCANESRITNYDRLAGSETNHSRNVGAIIRAVSPASFLYCRGGAVLPTFVDLHGALLNSIFGWNIYPELDPPIHVVTRSNSNNDNTSYTTVDRDWDNFVYSNAIPAFNSGGNTGNGTGNVRSPGKGLNVITVGNYNDATDTIVGSSPFNDPQTGNRKPEVAAPGASITAGGFTMTGTSQATPHAAAFAADMMSSSTYLKGRPYLVKAKLLAGATDPITGGTDKVGLGGIDFASAHWSGHASWWEGSNASFTSFAQNDGTSDSYVEKRVWISSYWDRARVVLSWLTRGTYTYDHRTDAHPIGMDLDLRVYDPNGNWVGGSFSWDDAFERVDFTPTVSGYYTIKVNRFANRDTALNLRMGLYVNYYND